MTDRVAGGIFKGARIAAFPQHAQARADLARPRARRTTTGVLSLAVVPESSRVAGGPASGMCVRGQARRGSGCPRLPGGGIPQERQNLITEQAILITPPEPQARMAAPRALPPSAAHV